MKTSCLILLLLISTVGKAQKDSALWQVYVGINPYQMLLNDTLVAGGFSESIREYKYSNEVHLGINVHSKRSEIQIGVYAQHNYLRYGTWNPFPSGDHGEWMGDSSSIVMRQIGINIGYGYRAINKDKFNLSPYVSVGYSFNFNNYYHTYSRYLDTSSASYMRVEESQYIENLKASAPLIWRIGIKAEYRIGKRFSAFLKPEFCLQQHIFSSGAYFTERSKMLGVRFGAAYTFFKY